jgi:hypothetical protein
VHADKNISGYKTNIIQLILHINVARGNFLFDIISTIEGFQNI